ncbi:heavy-metal-associated domain-containing protein [Roseimaritima ulvae]|uniref:Heavy-metal-associated domain protein n=1 Tax=Roseimaritima ulvae TaxID=980254 RepID=A0A5B9QX43_9BACT|nr:heavy-metal-associated domain-containing protein [Roseimaritima ulvae]QEG38523.1 hypothetical protein UC8_04800 [Roseimaritima ulvae]
MRFLIYIPAVLVSAGLIYYVSQAPDAPPVTQGDGAQPAAVDVDYPDIDAGELETGGLEAGETQLVTLHVPEMHCPFACYPAVKKALEAEPGVVGVDLAEQKQEGVIDNPEVKIQVSDAFDAQAAIDALAKAGFDKSTTVQ